MWTEPKTNWHCISTKDSYEGDYFDYTDFNRIKNNTEVLMNEGRQYMRDYWKGPVIGPDKGYDDWAEEDILTIVEAIRFNARPTCVDLNVRRRNINNSFYNYEELNEIESTLKEAHKRYESLNKSGKHLGFNLERSL